MEFLINKQMNCQLLLIHCLLVNVSERPQEAGLEIATNMVANATNFFSLATKTFV